MGPNVEGIFPDSGTLGKGSSGVCKEKKQQAGSDKGAASVLQPQPFTKENVEWVAEWEELHGILF
jgi:hypothetical protein